ncbi:hypothetical protein [uncultured Winogradskyella sp.]|uniref:hypothetical protein n=1 Tax=uncultured Winogradskyella sp. TaxID=395353 RepID=UPI00262AAF70|nr:hypothetical protein [uncultured Winogradskyella sp.]
MATLQQQLARVQKLTPTHMSNVLFEYLKSLEDEMAELNRQQLFKKSEDIFGQPLGTYSRATEYITTNEALLGKETIIKREGEPYDFKQTGVFLPSIFAKVVNQQVIFGSTDPKLSEIFDNIRLKSKSFFGLQDVNKVFILQERVLPYLQNYIRKELKL